MIISTYIDTVTTIDTEHENEILEQAARYNASLMETSSQISSLNPSEYALYQNQLNTQSGIMGYIEIPEINVSLPIVHGIDSQSLSNAVGHFPGSSLPIGGESTHAILSAHSGSPHARLFTDIHQLKEGSRFYIQIFHQRMEYEVCNIVVKKPEDTGFLRIIEGEDLCTLVTCTPYGINTERLCITGKRVCPKQTPDWHIHDNYAVPWQVLLLMIFGYCLLYGSVLYSI